MESGHPSEAALRDLQSGRLPAEQQAPLREHVAHCEECSARLGKSEEGATRTVDAPANLPREFGALRPGEHLGRFVVAGTLGEGGMGVVYLARDVELDREVAVKLLRDRGEGSGGEQGGRARLFREAQAMARLSHPNVVTVYEVGVHDGTVFLAMERVDGSTLKAWLAAKKRTWQEILAVFIQAGRGLAAAHAAGLIHRDFKPDNVLIRADGRGQVTDFGLARAVGVAPAEGGPSPSPRSDALATPVTVAGTLVGTLAYMAPEQLEGGTLDARTDAFAFCIALYEALHGERPFERVGHALRRKALKERGDVPTWLGRVIEQGLSLAPDARFATMDALLKALSADPSAKRRRAAAAGVGVAAVALAAGLSWWGAARHARTQCETQAEQLQGVWDEAARKRLAAAFATSGIPDAANRWHYVEKGLDRYAKRWLDAQAQACAAAGTEREADSAVHARLECLNEGRDDLRTVVELLGAPNQTLVDGAAAIISLVRSTTRCRDARLIPFSERRTPAELATIRAYRSRILHAAVLSYLGRGEEGIAALDRIRHEVHDAGLRRLEVNALDEGALLKTRAGQSRAALEDYQRALPLAEAEHMDLTALQIGTAAVVETAIIGASVEEVDRGLELVRRLADRLGDAPEAKNLVEFALGTIANLRGRSDEGLPHLQAALRIEQELNGVEDIRLVVPMNNIASAQEAVGQIEESIATCRETIRISDAIVGPDRDNLRIIWSNLAWALLEVGRFDEAADAARRTIREPENLYSAVGRAILAEVLAEQGRFSEATAEAQRTLDLVGSLKRRSSPTGVEVVRRSAKVFFLAGVIPRAKVLIDEAMTVGQKVLEPNAPEWVPFLSVAGATEVALGHGVPAVALLDRALTLSGAHPLYPGCVAEIRSLLARALVLARGDRVRAADLASQAAEELAKLPWRKAMLDDLNAWRARTFPVRAP